MAINQGKVRVGTIRYSKDGSKILPSYPNFEPIEVMTASTKYGSLGPYQLKTEKGYIMENVWQFSKIYRKVPAITQHYSRWDEKVIWQYPEEQHVNNQSEVTLEYFKWRMEGYRNPYAVRYPVGYADRSACLGCIWDANLSIEDNICPSKGTVMDYVTSRQVIYLPVYRTLARAAPQFAQLKKKLEAGTNLLIMEVDGPQSQAMDYYQKTYGVPSDWISSNSIEMNKEAFQIMLNDTRYSFGHGYCLAQALLDEKDEW